MLYVGTGIKVLIPLAGEVVTYFVMLINIEVKLNGSPCRPQDCLKIALFFYKCSK